MSYSSTNINTIQVPPNLSDETQLRRFLVELINEINEIKLNLNKLKIDYNNIKRNLKNGKND